MPCSPDASAEDSIPGKSQTSHIQPSPLSCFPDKAGSNKQPSYRYLWRDLLHGHLNKTRAEKKKPDVPHGKSGSCYKIQIQQNEMPQRYAVYLNLQILRELFLIKNRRICNYLRIKRLFGLHGNWVTRWQPFLFQSSLLFCINDITPDTQRYNFFMNEQKGGAFFIIAG